jgi:PAS domain S-box-containing protein
MPAQSRSVAAAVIPALVALTTLVLAGFGGLNYRSHRELEWKKLHDSLEADADQLAAALVLPVWNFDREQIKAVLASAMKAESAQALRLELPGGKADVQILLKDDHGRVRAATGTLPKAGLLVESRDLKYANEAIGQVQLFATTRFVEGELKRSLLVLAGNILALDLVLTAGLYLLLRRIVFEPLGEIGAYATALSSGSGETPLSPRRFCTELETVRLSIRKMVALLEARYAEPQEAARQQRASEQRYRVLVETTNEGIWVQDPENRTTYVNRALADMLGYAPAEILGKRMEDFTFPGDLPFPEEPMGDAGRDEIYERRFRRRDGAALWAVVSARALKDEQGHIVGAFAMLTDLTARKRAEEGLLESQTTLKAVIESTSDMVWSVDRKSFGLLTFNRSLRDYIFQQYGVWIEPEMRPEDLLPTADLARCWREMYERVLAEGPYTTEYTTQNGARVFQFSFSLLQREARVFGVSVFGKEITERKWAEDKLNRQIAFEGLVNKLLAGFASATSEGMDAQIRASLGEVGGFIGVELAHVIQIASDSKRWSVTHEWSQTQRLDMKERYQQVPFGAAPWVENQLLAGETVQIDRLDDFPPEAAAERERHVAEGLRSSLRVPLHGREGRFKGCLGLYASSREVVWRQEDVRRLRILSDAIANALERKMAEDSLRLSEERFRGIFENAPVGIFQTSLDGRMLNVNPIGSRMFGFATPEEMVAAVSEVAGQLFMAPEQRAPLLQTAVQSEKFAMKEVEYRRRDGTTFLANLYIRAVKGEGGAVPFLEGFLEDVTARNLAERRLRKSHEQLRALSSRLESLREEERTRLSREIHDHLGQLLTALKLDLRSLERRIAAMPTAEPKTALNEKITSARGLADEMISSVQKIASELRPGILDRLGLTPALEVEAQTFQTRTGIVCELILPEQSPVIAPEQTTAVFRIFQEVLTNVARHAHATHVTVRLGQEGRHLVLQIQDNGIGMPPNALEEPKSLGLLGMRERAAILGGKVSFAASAGQGTTVTLQIPLDHDIGKVT